MVCRRLKSDPATAYIPFVLLSSFNDARDIVNIVNSGADMFMLKRFDEKYFLTRISDFLASRKLHNAREDGAKHLFSKELSKRCTGTNVQLTEMVLSAFATVVHLLPLVHQD